MPYEVVNAFTRLVAGGVLPPDKVAAACEALMALPITYHELADIPPIVHLAGRLRRHSAYDAAYLSLTLDLESLTLDLEATLWTFDRPLARNADAADLPIHLLS